MGGRGAHVLLAGAGHEFEILDGGPGHDRLRGADSDDYLISGDAICGAGIDRLTPSSRHDHLDADCELAGFDLPLRGAVADGKRIEVEFVPQRPTEDALRFRGTCPYTDLDGYANGVLVSGIVTVTLARGGKALGSGRIPAKAARRCDAAHPDGTGPLTRFEVQVHLNVVGRRLLSAGRAVRIVVAYRGRDVPPVPWAVTVESR